ncbi:hypothetical protein HGM15179_019954 [Zosterops borbonicus]|uniref:Uncharacterized protein n=1 Tax=Zosterops borbonicus TaxID=364589 RepID=A0A8K1D777_9PASS|nr:hypothetical protein HGM15179_019954 [Zosterops borbonicus]
MFRCPKELQGELEFWEKQEPGNGIPSGKGEFRKEFPENSPGVSQGWIWITLGSWGVSLEFGIEGPHGSHPKPFLDSGIEDTQDPSPGGFMEFGDGKPFLESPVPREFPKFLPGEEESGWGWIQSQAGRAGNVQLDQGRIQGILGAFSRGKGELGFGIWDKGGVEFPLEKGSLGWDFGKEFPGNVQGKGLEAADGQYEQALKDQEGEIRLLLERMEEQTRNVLKSYRHHLRQIERIRWKIPKIMWKNPGITWKNPGIMWKTPRDSMEKPWENVEIPRITWKTPGKTWKNPGIMWKIPRIMWKNPGKTWKTPQENVENPRDNIENCQNNVENPLGSHGKPPGECKKKKTRIMWKTPGITWKTPGILWKTPGIMWKTPRKTWKTPMENLWDNVKNSGIIWKAPGKMWKIPRDNVENPRENMENPRDNVENPWDNLENPWDNVENSQDIMEQPQNSVENPGIM